MIRFSLTDDIFSSLHTFQKDRIALFSNAALHFISIFYPIGDL